MFVLKQLKQDNIGFWHETQILPEKRNIYLYLSNTETYTYRFIVGKHLEK